MKIDSFNSVHPSSGDLSASSENTSGITQPVITAKDTGFTKNDARPQAHDSTKSTSHESNSTQTSSAKSRVTRAEEEPVHMAGEAWPDFQERHYRWRLRIPSYESVDRSLIPENEGKIPPSSLKDTLIEGLIGLATSGPGAAIRPATLVPGVKLFPSPKPISGLKPGPRPGSSGSPPGTPGARPGAPGPGTGTSASRPSAPGSRPGAPSSRPGTPSSGPSTPGSRPGSPGSRPSAPNSGPGTPASRPGTPGVRSQATTGATLPIIPDALQTFAINNGNVSFAGKDKGYIYKGIVFRGDTRPTETIFREGFKLRTKINDINEINGFRGGFGGGHNALDPDGKGISTSGFYKKSGVGAYYYGGDKGGYTYIIDGSNMEGYHLYQNRHHIEHPNDTRVVMQPLEINYGADIPPSNIIGAFDKNGHFIQNSNYRGTYRIPPHQEHHHHYTEYVPPSEPQSSSEVPSPSKPESPSESQPQWQAQPQPQTYYPRPGTSHHGHRIPTFGSTNPHGWTGNPFEEWPDRPFIGAYDP